MTDCNRYAKAIVGDTDYGLDILLCKSILVPKESGAVLRSKIAAVHRRLDEAIAGVDKRASKIIWNTIYCL